MSSAQAHIIDKILFMSDVTDDEPQESIYWPGTIDITTKQLDDPQEVRQWLGEFDAQTGWVQTTSEVCPHDAWQQAVGPVLCAELAGHGESRHIRQDSRGQWIGSVMRTVQDDEVDGLITQREVLGKMPYGRLRYHVAWRPQETTDGFEQWQPYAARLIHDFQGE